MGRKAASRKSHHGLWQLCAESEVSCARELSPDTRRQVIHIQTLEGISHGLRNTCVHEQRSQKDYIQTLQGISRAWTKKPEKLQSAGRFEAKWNCEASTLVFDTRQKKLSTDWVVNCGPVGQHREREKRAGHFRVDRRTVCRLWVDRVLFRQGWSWFWSERTFLMVAAGYPAERGCSEVVLEESRKLGQGRKPKQTKRRKNDGGLWSVNLFSLGILTPKSTGVRSSWLGG